MSNVLLKRRPTVFCLLVPRRGGAPLVPGRLALQQRERGVAALLRRHRPRHYLHWLLWQRKGAGARADLALAQKYRTQLYAAAAACAPGKRLLDGGKQPARALALAKTPGVQWRVLHLICGPRALVARPGAALSSSGYHRLAGNPIRFGGQPLTLRRDERFRTAMAPWRRLVVLLLTAPLALRYGYLRP